MQPEAATRRSNSSASQRSDPSPSTKTVPMARNGPSGEQERTGGIAHDDIIAIGAERPAAALGIVMRQAVDQYRASGRRQRHLGEAANLGAGKQHQRIRRHGDKGMFAHLQMGTLHDGVLMRPVHDGRSLRGHVHRRVRLGNDRQRNIIAAIKAARGRLQIKRRNIAPCLVEIERPRGVERVRDALPRQDRAPAAVAEAQRCFDRAANAD
jgi:hypothetical protein